MFDTVEKYHRFFKVLLALIALSFVTFGVHAFTASGHDYIATVGSEKISEQELRRVMQNNQIPADHAMREQVFRSLLQQAYLIEGGKEMGVTVSDQQVKDMIVKEAAFSENGQFSPQKYAQFLSNGQMSEAQLVDNLRKEFISQNVLHLLSSSVMVSDVQAAQLLQVYDAEREMQMAFFNDADFADKVSVGADEIQQFYKAHQDRYTTPQAIQYAYVKADVATLQAQQTVSDEELKTRMSAEPDADATLLQAQIKEEKASRALSVAKETMAEVAFNQAKDIEAVGKAVHLPVSHEKQWASAQEIQQSALPAVVQAALFSDEVLLNGNNSDALQAADGSVWVVRVEAVREAKVQPLDTVQDAVRADFVQQEAHKMALSAAQKAYAALEKGEAVDVSWQAKQTLSLPQAKEQLDNADFVHLIQAVPQEGKPAYVLTENAENPMIIKVLKIHAPHNQAEKLPLAKIQLAQANGAQAVNTYLQYLERTIKYKQGLQKVGSDEDNS